MKHSSSIAKRKGKQKKKHSRRGEKVGQTFKLLYNKTNNKSQPRNIRLVFLLNKKKKQPAARVRPSVIRMDGWMKKVNHYL